MFFQIAFHAVWHFWLLYRTFTPFKCKIIKTMNQMCRTINVKWIEIQIKKQKNVVLFLNIWIQNFLTHSNLIRLQTSNFQWFHFNIQMTIFQILWTNSKYCVCKQLLFLSCFFLKCREVQEIHQQQILLQFVNRLILNDAIWYCKEELTVYDVGYRDKLL